MRAAAPQTGDANRPGWPEVLHVGLCVLRLSPQKFWRLSPREFMAMAGGYRPHRVAMERADMEALMRLFPDEAERS